MIYGLYHSAAGMMTNEYRQNVIANNLANADTVGFKRDIAAFAERKTAKAEGLRHGPSNETLDALSGGLWLGRTDTDFSVGAIVPTGNHLDVALQGPGFLVAATTDGPAYTRDGRMVMDAQGCLRAASDGAPILGSGGQPILLNPYGSRPRIDEDGRIWQNGAQTGQLALADFEDYHALRKTGAERFLAPDELKIVPTPAVVRAGYVEDSGVEAVTELVGMIEASRAYQLNAQMVSLQDQTAGRLISQVANG